MKKLTWKDIRTKKLNLTQEELAKKLNISRQLYSMKENYNRKMKIDEAVEIARLSGVDLENVKLM